MDIVYILGTGSRFDDEEIRYSLRSLCNLPHNNVYVIGEKPDFFSDAIRHIPAEDPYEVKQQNAFHKLRIACEVEDISDDFILMNDDFFILKTIDNVEYYYRDTLDNSIAKHPSNSGDFYNAMVFTRDLLGGGKDFAHHSPFVYNKKRLSKLLQKEYGSVVHLRTLYANTWQIEGIQREDVKCTDKKSYLKLIEGDMISTDDLIFGSNRFQKKIKQLFPEICKYERI